MRKSNLQPVLAMIVVGSASLVQAAAPSIGVAMSNGTLMVNNSVAAGNATLLNGNTIETAANVSELRLNSGTTIQLASESRAKVYDDRAVLEKGLLQVSGKPSYEVDASVLKIVPDEPNASASISIHGPTVEVASLAGPVSVRNGSGVLVKTITPGMVFDFTPQDAGAAPAGQTPPPPPPAKGGKSKSSAGGGHSVPAAAVIAGILVAAGIGATAAVLATNGDNNSASVSPDPR